MTPSSFQTPVSLAGITIALEVRDKAKHPYYVGIEGLNPAHDYQKLHYILMHFRAEKVSRRIWMLVLDTEEIALALQLMKQCMSSHDQLIVAQAPKVDAVPQRIAA